MLLDRISRVPYNKETEAAVQMQVNSCEYSGGQGMLMAIQEKAVKGRVVAGCI